MNTYGYCRVSTDRQANEGESLGTQERVIQGYCMMHNFTDVKFFIEQGVSASIPLADRPQGNLLLSVLKPGDVVVTPKLDRMFRSSLDALITLESFQERNISLHMLDLGGDVTTGTMAKFMFTILSAVSEVERARIRERIKEVKQDQKKRGRYLGGKVPFGFRVVDQALEKYQREQETIEHIHYLKHLGWSLRDIGRHTGVAHSVVHKILNRAL